MRLAFIIRDLGHGGAQRQLVTLARGLVREGLSVSVIHFYDGAFRPELEAAGVQTLCVGKKSRRDLLGFFFRLVKAVRGVRPEVLHGYLAESNLMALFLKPFCGFPRVVWGVRDSQTDAHLWGLLGRLSFRLNCLLARFADVIICNSKAGRDYYLARGYPEHKTHVVPNGIDTERFQAAGKSAQCSVLSAQISELSAEHSPLGTCFGLVGRLSPMKDLATFIKAAALVPEARFVIVGSGDETYARQMRDLATALGVSLTWLPAQSDMPSVYATFDCLVNSSAFGEGFSNVIGEAMACGVPCIASDVGDSAWIIGNPAQIFPAGDHEALAKRMREMCRKGVAKPARLIDASDNITNAQKPGGSAKTSEDIANAFCAEHTRPTASPRQRIVEEFSIEKLIERTRRLLAKKVLWITTGLGSGGAEMMLAQLVNGLPQFQHVVVSLTSGGKHAASMPEVHSLDMPAGRPTLRALWRLFKIVRQTRPDVLMGWMYHGCLVATLAKCMRIKRVPMIWNIRQSLYDLKLEKRGSALVIRALAKLSWLPQCITYNSQLSAKQHEAVGYRAAKTLLIPNGFDLTKWQPDTPVRGRIGRFGRNAPMKDYPTFIEAAKLIHTKHPEAKFIIVGAETETLDVPPFIEVLGERHDLPALTASLNIAVSSSAYGEGFPNVVGEAMACAVPVVATDIGDTRWVMGETGRIVPPRDSEALAKACIGILDAGITQDLAARERIETHFSLTSVLKQFESLLSHPHSSQSSHSSHPFPLPRPCAE
ncbi:MAG: glycosyltransferase [Prosthecobacter sp.]|nr:glycosyltransferase [Prosthecobacter sp.]